jgi:anti-sigma factor RsiW
MEEALGGKLEGAQRERFEALLSSDPAIKREWEEEIALNSALSKLPDAPLSTNFTTLVLQRAQLRERARGRGFRFWPRWSWTQATAMAGIVLGLGLLGLQYRHYSMRQEMAQQLAIMNKVASDLPAGSATAAQMELLSNFDAIRTLAYVPAQSDVDMELLTALEK